MTLLTASCCIFWRENKTQLILRSAELEVGDDELSLQIAWLESFDQFLLGN